MIQSSGKERAMSRKYLKNQEERSKIRDKIENFNKYQWLVFIPLWLVTILQISFPARTIPIPEIYILLLDVGALLFSVIAFIAIRLQIQRWKVKLEQLEKSEKYAPQRSKSPRSGA
ncbi:MAG: hypothetical protein ABI210_00335 [Abditibacteriaceae bacterium]